jgi:hypothetical protein
LPSDIFPLPSITGRKEPVETEFTEGGLDLTALKAKVLLYENAIEELQMYYDHQKEIVKNTFEVDNTGIQNSQNDLIDKATIEQTKKPFISKSSAGRIKKWEKLSENTRLALTNIKAHTDLSIPFIIKGLQKKADAATRTLWENVQLHKDVVNVGGALWVYDGKAHLRGKPDADEALFHLWAMSKPSVQTNVLLKEPIDPRSKQMAEILGHAFKKHTDITVSNYALLAAQYGATIDAPPSAEKTVEKNYTNKSDLDVNKDLSQGFNDLTIPQGYSPAFAKLLIAMSGSGGNQHWLTIAVGSDAVFVNEFNKNGLHHLTLSLANEVETLPVSICGKTSFYTINVNVVCERNAEYFETWQIKTFKAVIDAYENQKAAYEQAVAEAKIQRGVDIQGTNPAMNRIIEQQELKKGCLGWLNNGQDFSSSAVSHYNDNDDCISPVTNYGCNTIQETERAKFFEQGFDWKLMTYTFLPYFWGNKCRWRKMYQLDDTDPLFLNFLQAGMAKVLVPVRPGYEKQVMHFLRTGQIWQGSEVPAINSPIYLSIVEELKAPVGIVEGEPWEIRVPTALTVLQCNSGCVEGEGLPCNCDDEVGFGRNTEGVLEGEKG